MPPPEINRQACHAETAWQAFFVLLRKEKSIVLKAIRHDGGKGAVLGGQAGSESKHGFFKKRGKEPSIREILQALVKQIPQEHGQGQGQTHTAEEAVAV